MGVPAGRRLVVSLASVLITGCTAAPTSTSGSHRTARPFPASTPVLTQAQIVKRCQSQIRAREGGPGYRGIRRAVLSLAYQREYRAGDLVRPLDTRDLPSDVLGYPHFPLLLCRIPWTGTEKPSPTAFTGRLSADQLRELCAETYAIPAHSRPGGWLRPDLRSARILARADARGFTAALFALDGSDHGCLIPSPASGELPYSGPDQPTRGYRTWFVPTAVPHGDDRGSFDWLYATWGRLPARAWRITFIRSDGSRTTTAVAEDGSYAMIVDDPAGKLTDKTRYEVTDRNGNVLGTGPALRGRPMRRVVGVRPHPPRAHRN